MSIEQLNLEMVQCQMKDVCVLWREQVTLMDGSWNEKKWG